ncbi:MAG: metalloregulator ArsR/SmtB family transcription factor [Capsulimonadales bacterium]|nr:metalloregulator ArsR/SmtB family transcription factor [Capsulimonadales bacterium]
MPETPAPGPVSGPETLPTEANADAGIAAMLKALGEPTRLRIFQFLRSCCCPVAVDESTGEVRPVSGPTVGEICCHITGRDRINSTISEHLKDLRLSGLILVERRGKQMICAANPAALTALRLFFHGTETTPPIARADDEKNAAPTCCEPTEERGE